MHIKFNYSLSLSLSAGFRFTIIILMLFFNDYLFTQVRIKEKVVIAPNLRHIIQHNRSMSPNLWVAPYTGTYFGQIYLAAKYNLVFDTLRVITNDTILNFYTLDYTPIRGQYTGLAYDKCNGYSEVYYNVVYAHAYGTNVGIMIPDIQEGDTIQFLYKDLTHYPAWGGYINGVGIAKNDPLTGSCYIYYEGSLQDLEYCEIKLTLADTVIKFSELETNSICPTIPGYNDALSRKNYIDLELKVTYGSFLLNNVWVKVNKPTIIDSGGHSHNGNRPMGKYRLRRAPPDTGYYAPVDSFLAKTDMNGIIRFKYIASEFGGIEQIQANLLSDTTNYDLLNIKVKVDSLVDFSTISSDYWILTGNSGTTSYGRCSGAVIRHHSNHWFHQSYVNSLQNAILDFYSWTGTFNGGNKNLKLRINDMSLKFGGLFDICSNWRGGHFYHRTGISVDISKSAIRVDNNQMIALSKNQINRLEKFMKKYGGKRYPEPSIHFGFGGNY